MNLYLVLYVLNVTVCDTEGTFLTDGPQPAKGKPVKTLSVQQAIVQAMFPD